MELYLQGRYRIQLDYISEVQSILMQKKYCLLIFLFISQLQLVFINNIMDQAAKKQKMEEVIAQLKTTMKQKIQSKPTPLSPAEEPPQKHQQKIKLETRVDTEEDFRKLPYEGKVRYDYELKNLTDAREKKQTSDVGKVKKCFWEHYDKEGIYEPAFIKQTNHPNPSGRPPNIPDEMYENIVVKPKRPWVYDGDENMPEVMYEQCNDQAFKSVMKKTQEDKEQVIHKRPNMTDQKPRKRKILDENGEGENEGHSNFDISDSFNMSLDSVLYSEIQSRKNRSMKDEDDEDEDEHSFSTKKKASIFNQSEESDNEDKEIHDDEEINMDEEFKIIEESDSKPEKKKKKRGRKSKAEKMIDDMSDL